MSRNTAASAIGLIGRRRIAVTSLVDFSPTGFNQPGLRVNQLEEMELLHWFGCCHLRQMLDYQESSELGC
ncbi:hypothetical protein AAHA92_03233 [Salvia divinorum]|uniref:Uncharacterized protein n=1 Tax=Salvia divinorum TaxID=28513 RepID=A0ABD1IH20_SALDI